MKTQNFADIEQEFIEKAHRMVWCNAATVDSKNRVRSRVLHPIWEGSTGWILTSPQSLKAKHLANNPTISIAYIAEPLTPMYAECTAAWINEAAEKQRLWDLFANTPEPLGYNPTPFFQSVDSPHFGVLKLIPWRIELGNLTGQSKVWEAEL